jgi:hypothetical protein
MPAHSQDPHRLLAGLHKTGVSLDLSTLDLCFLAALHLRADQDGLASFEEVGRGTTSTFIDSFGTLFGSILIVRSASDFSTR